ncbi:MAG: MFS transporter [Corynebacterium sp.]|nr:MFS transporter [Corynebacterium sp.]
MATSMTPAAGISTAPRATAREWAAFSILVLSVVLLTVDATVLSLAIPSITNALAATGTQILWMGDIYSLMISGLLITMGNVADRFGRKKLLLLSALGFGLASLLAAFAPSPEILILARALMGTTGAGLMPSTLALIRTIFKNPRQRTTAISIWAAGASAGAAFGPLIGGLLLSHFWWGSVFLVNAPIVAIILIAGFILLPESRNEKSGPIDLPSVVLSILAIIPLVYTVKHVFSDGLSLGMLPILILGLVAGWGFARRQRRMEEPLFDLELFKLPSFSSAILVQFIAVFATSGLIYFFSQYLQFVRGFSPLEAGLIELPNALSATLIIVVAAAMVRSCGVNGAMALALIINSIGFAGLAFSEHHGSVVLICISFVFVGLGGGLGFALGTDAIVGSAPADRSGAASAISETSYELGAGLGIAILGSMMAGFYRFNGGFADSIATAHTSFERGLIDATTFTQASGAFSGAMVIVTLVSAAIMLGTAVIAYRQMPRQVEANAHQ